MQNSLGDSVEIFTGIMQDHYSWPEQFGFDFMTYTPPGKHPNVPVVADPASPEFNADSLS